MTLSELRPYARFTYRKNLYLITEIAQNSLFYCDNESNQFELDRVIFSELLQTDEIKLLPNLVTISDIDIEDQHLSDTALYKYRIIEPFLCGSIPSTYQNINDHINKVHEIFTSSLFRTDSSYSSIHKPSQATFYRWLNKFKSCNYNLSSLENKLVHANHRIDPKVDRIIKNFIDKEYLTNSRISTMSLYRCIFSHLYDLGYTKKEIPCYATICNRVNQIPHHILLKNRYSERDAKKTASPIISSIKTQFPLERVEIDCQDMDVMVITEDGSTVRPRLVAAIDVFTKSILGFCLSLQKKAGWDEVSECLNMVINPKNNFTARYPSLDGDWPMYGIPRTLVIDNGLEFKNNYIQNAALELNMTLQFAQPRVPEMKPFIERFFRTLNDNFIHELPGTTRSSPSQLAEGEIPAQNATLTFPLLKEIFIKYIVEVYHRQVHSSIHTTPEKQWRKHKIFSPELTPLSTQATKYLLAKTTERKLKRNGFELHSIIYSSPELNEIYMSLSPQNKKKSFKIKYNTKDINEISVLIDEKKQLWIEVPSTTPEETLGLSLQEHILIRNVMKELITFEDEAKVYSVRSEIKKMIIESNHTTNKIDSSDIKETIITNYKSKEELLAKEKSINDATELLSSRKERLMTKGRLNG